MGARDCVKINGLANAHYYIQLTSKVNDDLKILTFLNLSIVTNIGGKHFHKSKNVMNFWFWLYLPSFYFTICTTLKYFSAKQLQHLCVNVLTAFNHSHNFICMRWRWSFKGVTNPQSNYTQSKHTQIYVMYT